jgi:hypothetical protein
MPQTPWPLVQPVRIGQHLQQAAGLSGGLAQLLDIDVGGGCHRFPLTVVMAVAHAIRIFTLPYYIFLYIELPGFGCCTRLD